MSRIFKGYSVSFPIVPLKSQLMDDELKYRITFNDETSITVSLVYGYEVLELRFNDKTRKEDGYKHLNKSIEEGIMNSFNNLKEEMLEDFKQMSPKKKDSFV